MGAVGGSKFSNPRTYCVHMYTGTHPRGCNGLPASEPNRPSFQSLPLEALPSSWGVGSDPPWRPHHF